MNPPTQDQGTEGQPAKIKEKPTPLARRRNSRPPLPEEYKQLRALCRAGKLFAVQKWFKIHKYNEPERYDHKHWPMGIAIEKGFHSLVVVLQSGLPAVGRALEWAADYRNKPVVELLFEYTGADVRSADFEYITISLATLLVQTGYSMPARRRYPFLTFTKPLTSGLCFTLRATDGTSRQSIQPVKFFGVEIPLPMLILNFTGQSLRALFTSASQRRKPKGIGSRKAKRSLALILTLHNSERWT